MKNFVLILLIVLAVGCSRAENSGASISDEKMMSEQPMEEPPSPESTPRRSRSDEESSLSDMTTDDSLEYEKQNIDSRDAIPAMEYDGRMLEYNLSLEYASKDVLASRLAVYNVISHYGFLMSTNTVNEDSYPYVQVSFKVETKKLYDMLTELNRAGKLKRENISVTDMTPDSVYRAIKKNREVLRLKRREEALLNYNLARLNYEERERMLESSENNLDETEFQIWQLEDRATWSVVSVYVYGPSQGISVFVPNFGNAFIKMINGVLGFLYGVVLYLPLVIIIVLSVIFRKQILSFLSNFSKKKKSANNENIN
jgi:hypothetical protein